MLRLFEGSGRAPSNIQLYMALWDHAEAFMLKQPGDSKKGQGSVSLALLP